jgi:GT2 family glycosyltransferase
MPKVSVIIPTYNCAHYLEQAIESAMNQTYRDLEIIEDCLLRETMLLNLHRAS